MQEDHDLTQLPGRHSSWASKDSTSSPNIFSLQSTLESIFINTISMADDSCHVMAARLFYAGGMLREADEHRQK